MNNSDKFEYSVVRSRRKSICIEIDRDLNIKVRAPLRMTDSQIQSFVDSRQNWIRSHLEIMQKRPSRVEHFAQIIDVTYGRITIRHQKTRWGSCSSSGNLNFNCALMNTTPEIIDYVVVHELCHRKQMNHSALFWAEVEKVLPNYKELRSALKNYRC